MPSTPTAWLIVAAGRIELAGDHVAGRGTPSPIYWEAP